MLLILLAVNLLLKICVAKGVCAGFCLAFDTRRSAQNACACAVMRLNRHGFANKIFNYDEIIIQFFTFVAKICKIFKKSVTKNHKKGLQRLKIWAGGGLLCFCEIFWGFVWGWGIFLGLLNFWALFGMC